MLISANDLRYIVTPACYTRTMCGRFTQHLSWEELHRLADLIGQPRDLAPRYNIALTTRIEVIRLSQTSKELAPVRVTIAVPGFSGQASQQNA
jgi:putative SOS response-associated peptidase YedK